MTRSVPVSWEKPHLCRFRGAWGCFDRRTVYIESTALSAYAAHARQQLRRGAVNAVARESMLRFMKQWDRLFCLKSDHCRDPNCECKTRNSTHAPGQGA